MPSEQEQDRESDVLPTFERRMRDRRTSISLVAAQMLAGVIETAEFVSRTGHANRIAGIEQSRELEATAAEFAQQVAKRKADR